MRFARSGVASVGLRVRSDDGATAVVQLELTVRGHPPDVSLSADRGETGVAVSMSAYATDPDGDRIAAWAWDLDDDGDFDDGTGPSAAPSFARAGNHAVRVRATDDEGDQGTAEAILDITGRPPTAAADVSPQPVTAGAAVTLDARPSSDPDGAIAAYAWDTDGDGGFDIDGPGAVVTHRFATPGLHYVTLRVTDDSGASDTAEIAVRVTGAAAARRQGAASARRAARSAGAPRAAPTTCGGRSAAGAWAR